jgi:N-acetylmuramoyl-L-alanine amidase
VNIERRSTSHYRRGRGGHRVCGVVIHTNVGSFESTVHWFADPASGVSAHYLVGLDGRVAQFVDEADTAQHAGRVRNPTTELVAAGDPNLYTVGIEFEDGGDPHGVARGEAQYRIGGELLRQIAARWSIPLDRAHVVGHREIYDRKSCPGNLSIDQLLRQALR